MDDGQAAVIAKHLVLANLRGVDSHGISRVEVYTKRLDKGLVNKKFNPVHSYETPASALIDAQNTSGIPVATYGIELAIKKAKNSGIGIVGINNSNHCGMLADYVAKAAEEDCIAIAATNAPANMPPWGGKRDSLVQTQLPTEFQQEKKWISYLIWQLAKWHEVRLS